MSRLLTRACDLFEPVRTRESSPVAGSAWTALLPIDMFTASRGGRLMPSYAAANLGFHSAESPKLFWPHSHTTLDPSLHSTSNSQSSWMSTLRNGAFQISGCSVAASWLASRLRTYHAHGHAAISAIGLRWTTDSDGRQLAFHTLLFARAAHNTNAHGSSAIGPCIHR